MEALAYGLVVGTVAGFLIFIAYCILKNRETAAFYTIGGLLVAPMFAAPWMEHTYHPSGGQSYSGGLLLGIIIALGFASTIAEAIRRIRGR
jgi:hypothetical protein